MRNGARVAAGFAVAVGLGALCGWWRGTERLTSIVHGWPALMPTTALMCVLAGGALGVLTRVPSRRGARLAGKLAAGLAALLAALTLLEHATGLSLGLDLHAFPVGPGLAGRFPRLASVQTA